MAASDHTERQDDSAFAGRSALSRAAHVRVVFGEPALIRELDSRGTSFGRTSDCDAADVVFDDARMSRRHARIVHDTLGWQLLDLGSRNGGYVNGAALRPHTAVALHDGAVIRLGDSIFVFRTEASPPREAESDAFPGGSLPASRVRDRLRKLAGASGHVLILGETGTGKERAARMIRREGWPFVPQNCAELTRELARSELFGHVRGAFSGASAAKPGLVEIAANGVLFLDEIGELALDVQGDLLRFLEDGTYRPVGATDLRRSTARVVAATNVNLEDAVLRGGFRRDLLARLRASNTPLQLPPLRERREDILSWADYFLREAGVAPARAWNAGAAECLLLARWPENLRELRGIVREQAGSEPRWPVSSSALPEFLQSYRLSLRQTDDAGVPARPAEPGVAPARPRTLSTDPTRDEIVAVLKRTNGQMRATSEALDIDRRKLYRLCEQHGIDFGAYRPMANRDED